MGIASHVLVHCFDMLHVFDARFLAAESFEAVQIIN